MRSFSNELATAVVSLPLRRRMRWALIPLLMILVAGAAFDAYMLFRYDFAVGVDGYYYQLQIKNLLSQGRFYFPTRTPFVLYLLSGVSYLSGNPIVTVKVVSIFLHTTLCVAVFALIMSATRSVGLGLCGAGVCVASGTHLYLVGEYVNNLGALTLLAWGAWGAVRFFQTRSKFCLSFGLFCFLGALFSHRSSWAIMLLLICTLISMLCLIKKKATSLLITPLLFLFWSAPALLAVQPFVQLPVWLKREFLVIPKFPVSTAAVAEQIILMLVAPLTLSIILFVRKPLSRRDQIPQILFGSLALWSLLLTINPFFKNKGAMDFTWRMSTLAYIQAALLVPGLIWFLLPIGHRAVILVAAFVLPLIIGSALFSRPYGLRPEYLSERGELLYRLPLIRDGLGSDPLVISPHGEQFVVTWALGIPSHQKWSDNNSSERVFWLLHHVEPNSLTVPVTVLLKQNDGGLIVVAKHEMVEEQLREMPNDERQRLLFNNPHLFEYVFGRANGARH